MTMQVVKANFERNWKGGAVWLLASALSVSIMSPVFAADTGAGTGALHTSPFGALNNKAAVTVAATTEPAAVGAAGGQPSSAVQPDATAGAAAAGTTASSPAGTTGDTAASTALQELSLNDLQDVGICLRLIGDQAKYIYEEASRTTVSMHDSPDIKPIRSIPYTVKGKVLPARQQWLVYYLASMEPVIRDLGKDVKDIETGTKQMVIPEAMHAALDPLWLSWSANTSDMNHQLDLMVPLFDDAANNGEKIRDLAVAIYKDVSDLETSRQAIFRSLQQSARTGKEKIMVSPLD
jgi:hypothetical protein